MGLHPYQSHQSAVLAAVINGIISVPIVFVMMRMVDNPKIMGEFVVGQRLSILGWLATAVMTLAVGVMSFRGCDKTLRLVSNS